MFLILKIKKYLLTRASHFLKLNHTHHLSLTHYFFKVISYHSIMNCDSFVTTLRVIQKLKSPISPHRLSSNISLQSIFLQMNCDDFVTTLRVICLLRKKWSVENLDSLGASIFIVLAHHLASGHCTVENIAFVLASYKVALFSHFTIYTVVQRIGNIIN